MVKANVHLSKQSWMFLIIGIPLIVVLFLLILGYQVINGLMMLITAGGLFLVTIRRKNFGIRATRTAFIAFVTCFFTVGSLVENPAMWASQVGRHVLKSSLIQPGDPKIVELDQAFKWWLENGTMDRIAYLTFYGENLTDPTRPMDDIYYNYEGFNITEPKFSLENFENKSMFSEFERLVIVDYFIRWHVVTWTSDSETHDVSDHIPTPSEALESWHFNAEWRSDTRDDENHARDDCDGIAVITVSFLRRLQATDRIDSTARIACGKSHWFTAAFLNDSTPVVFLNHWYSVHVYGIFMDNNLPAYGQNVLYTLNNLLITDEEDAEEMRYYLHFIGGLSPEILILVAFLIASFTTIFLGYPRNYDRTREKERVAGIMKQHSSKPKLFRGFFWLFQAKIGNPFGRRHLFFWINTAIMTLLLVSGAVFLYAGILQAPIFTYAQMFMYGAIFILIFLLDRDMFPRLFKWCYKVIIKRDFELYKSRE